MPVEVLVPLSRPTVPLARAVPLVQALLLVVVPHGGQLVARRNAWAGMACDAARSRASREAAAALALAGVGARRAVPGG
jgi:hypothetical protein